MTPLDPSSHPHLQLIPTSPAPAKSSSTPPLVAPFSWRGGKRRVAHDVWARFGQDVGHYTEPFVGGAAVLLARPAGFGGLETVNDLDGHIVNFWRALKLQPNELSRLARTPPSDVDLRTRHRWLRAERARIEAGLEDPTWCDPRAGAWWAWGQAHAYQQRWTDTAARPVLGPAPAGPNRLDGEALLRGLAERLQRVSVLRRDWSAVVSPSMLFRNRTKHVAVFLDPPYDGDEGLYAAKCPVAGDVWDWALEHGSDERLRLAVCGYDDGRRTPRGWSVLSWSSSGGGARRHEERIWFSPHCKEAPHAP